MKLDLTSLYLEVGHPVTHPQHFSSNRRGPRSVKCQRRKHISQSQREGTWSGAGWPCSRRNPVSLYADSEQSQEWSSTAPWTCPHWLLGWNTLFSFFFTGSLQLTVLKIELPNPSHPAQGLLTCSISHAQRCTQKLLEKRACWAPSPYLPSSTAALGSIWRVEFTILPPANKSLPSLMTSSTSLSKD